jgi:AraC-like DNA-binding protein
MSNPRASRIDNLPQLAHETGYSVKGLAVAWGLSVRVLERFFLAAYGEPPRRHLKRLQMRRAIELLRDGYNVTETSDCLGYHDRSHFSRVFQKYHGFAPKECTRVPREGPKIPRTSHSATKLSHLATQM